MNVPAECERAVDRVREAFDDDLRAVVVHHFPAEDWESGTSATTWKPATTTTASKPSWRP
ncbi:hypothetical protein U3A55_12650 [Salarchaeum sp. III]|uniref:hypothetical protein n=1 Tax=Salarchaeum sp. III TaxID=3107927 RepID=UPI002ED8BA5B